MNIIMGTLLILALLAEITIFGFAVFILLDKSGKYTKSKSTIGFIVVIYSSLISMYSIYYLFSSLFK